MCVLLHEDSGMASLMRCAISRCPLQHEHILLAMIGAVICNAQEISLILIVAIFLFQLQVQVLRPGQGGPEGPGRGVPHC